MFDVGYGELLLIAIVALLVLGPDKLPGALRTAGLWIGRMRRSFDRIRSEIEQEVGADDIRRQIHNELMMDQAREIRREIEAAAQTMKEGVQVPLSDMPGSRSAALARATTAAGEASAPVPATDAPGAGQGNTAGVPSAAAQDLDAGALPAASAPPPVSGAPGTEPPRSGPT